MSYLDSDSVQVAGVAEAENDGSAHRTQGRRQAKIGAVKRRQLLNYPGPDFVHMTKDEWRRLPSRCKGSWLEGHGHSGPSMHRVRVAVVHCATLSPVYIVDATRIDPPGTPARVPALPSLLPLAPH